MDGGHTLSNYKLTGGVFFVVCDHFLGRKNHLSPQIPNMKVSIEAQECESRQI